MKRMVTVLAAILFFCGLAHASGPEPRHGFERYSTYMIFGGVPSSADSVSFGLGASTEWFGINTYYGGDRRGEWNGGRGIDLVSPSLCIYVPNFIPGAVSIVGDLGGYYHTKDIPNNNIQEQLRLAGGGNLIYWLPLYSRRTGLHIQVGYHSERGVNGGLGLSF